MTPKRIQEIKQAARVAEVGFVMIDEMILEIERLTECVQDQKESHAREIERLTKERDAAIQCAIDNIESMDVPTSAEVLRDIQIKIKTGKWPN